MINAPEPPDFSLSCTIHFRIRLPGHPPLTVQRVVEAHRGGGVSRATVRNDLLSPPEDILTTGVAAPDPLDLVLRLVGVSSVAELVARDLDLRRSGDLPKLGV